MTGYSGRPGVDEAGADFSRKVVRLLGLIVGAFAGAAFGTFAYVVADRLYRSDAERLVGFQHPVPPRIATFVGSAVTLTVVYLGWAMSQSIPDDRPLKASDRGSKDDRGTEA